MSIPLMLSFATVDKTTFKQIAAVKALRALTGMGLKYTKDFVDDSPPQKREETLEEKLERYPSGLAKEVMFGPAVGKEFGAKQEKTFDSLLRRLIVMAVNEKRDNAVVVLSQLL